MKLLFQPLLLVFSKSSVDRYTNIDKIQNTEKELAN